MSIQRSGYHNMVRVLAATAGVAAATELLWDLHFNGTVAGNLFLTVVVFVATRVGIRLSLYVALLCALCFNYFFLPPLYTLRLASAQEWMELLSFMVSSVIVGRVAELARRQARQAEQRREDVERLYTLGQEMMLHDDAAKLMRDLPGMIARSFALDSVVLYIREQDRFHSSSAEVSASMQQNLRTITQGAKTNNAEGFAELPLLLGLTDIGALAWMPDTLSREVATAIAAQVAIALTRAVAIETYTRMEAAREGERLRTALIDSLTHELRTPLTSIRAAATTLVQGEGLNDEIRHELAALVDEESARLDKLIGEAVEMAEIDARVVRVSPVPQYARAMLEHAMEESRKALSGHRVIVDVEEPATPAWFDPHLLGRVLRHLLENAARYSPSGSAITLWSRRTGNLLEFRVQDTGPGIDAADLPFIFEKFYRGRQGKAVGKGTGMGLSITRAILEAHGGGIDVASTPKQGTEFHFWVPLVERQPENSAAQ